MRCAWLYLCSQCLESRCSFCCLTNAAMALYRHIPGCGALQRVSWCLLPSEGPLHSRLVVFVRQWKVKTCRRGVQDGVANEPQTALFI